MGKKLNNCKVNMEIKKIHNTESKSSVEGRMNLIITLPQHLSID